MAPPTSNSQSHSSSSAAATTTTDVVGVDVVMIRWCCHLITNRSLGLSFCEQKETLQSLLRTWSTSLASSITSLVALVSRTFRRLVIRLDPFWIHFLYFLSSSIIGFLALRVVAQKPGVHSPSALDLFFTSVSAATVSSMSTVEMEAFSNAQLVVIMLLMFVGGEVFNSMLHLHLLKAANMAVVEKNNKKQHKKKVVEQATAQNQLEAVVVVMVLPTANKESTNEINDSNAKKKVSIFDEDVKQRSITMLTLLILGFLTLSHIYGLVATVLYLTFFSASPRDVLRRKGINTTLYSAFLTVSSFANGGFVPTNEGMMPFKTNSGLLLLLLPLLLAGNTLFPPCLRFTLQALSRCRRKIVPELEYLKSNACHRELRFHHLLSKKNSKYLAYTVLCFVGVQLLLFCCLEWNSELLVGMNAAEKIVAALFQSVNSRHAGESVLDISTVAPAVTVLYIAMMYLPAYTQFLPGKDGTSISTSTSKLRKERREEEPRKLGLRKSLVMSHLSYILVFIILVCITERRRLSEDPLNFNIMSITTEVVSAYGNVGFSMGYSCERQLKPDSMCRDKWYGFVGSWSTEGKFILIIVMFFGRMKKFNMKGGRAWWLC